MPEGCVSKGLNKQQGLPKIFISCCMHVAVALRKEGCDRGGGNYLIFSSSCSEILFSSLVHKDFTDMGNKRSPVEMMLLAVPYRSFIWGCFSLSHSSSLSQAKNGNTNHPFPSIFKFPSIQNANCSVCLPQIGNLACTS